MNRCLFFSCPDLKFPRFQSTRSKHNASFSNMSVACLFQVTLQRYEDNVEQPNVWQDYFVFFLILFYCCPLKSVRLFAHLACLLVPTLCSHAASTYVRKLQYSRVSTGVFSGEYWRHLVCGFWRCQNIRAAA